MSPGSLLSARLALPEGAKPRHILAIGAGAQIQAHLALFLTAYPSIEECTIYNRSRNARLETLREMLASTFSSVRVAVGVLPGAHSKHSEAEYHDAVKQANIIITATSSTHPLFPSKLVRKGAHLCLIGSYKPEMFVQCSPSRFNNADASYLDTRRHEIDTDLVKRAGIIIVDQKTACLVRHFICAAHAAIDKHLL